MNQTMRKTIPHAMLGILFFAAPMAKAGSIEQNGSTITIGPDANWKPSDACTLSPPPTSNSDTAAISNYQAQRQKYMDCVRGEANADKQTMQQDLDRSLAAIGDDQLQQTDIIQQENRGALNRLGATRK